MPELASAKIVIRCRDYGASRHFYGSTLGLKVVDERAGRLRGVWAFEGPARFFTPVGRDGYVYGAGGVGGGLVRFKASRG